MARRLIACLVAALALTAAQAQIVTNGQFDEGGYTYVDGWRPLPGGGYRMLRKTDPRDGHSLFLRLRRDGDGGVAQTVDLPAKRTLSLRMLATCWANGTDCALATLTRLSDGMVLAEVRVDGIERGELAANFETGAGGPAELLVRLVGEAGARASVEYVEIGPPVDAACPVAGPDFSGADLVLRPGDGLRVDADFTPRLLPAAAEMLQAALEDATGHPTERVAGTVLVSVPQPETTEWPARESYHLSVCNTGITIEAPAEQGAFWAMMTLIDLIRPEPSGGARILAVDVHDQPALPWRIGVDPDLMYGIDPENGVRRLARLKLNAGLVLWYPRPRRAGEVEPDNPLSVGSIETMRQHGIEPAAYLSQVGEPDAQGMGEALREITRNLRTRFVSLELWLRESPAIDWTAEPLSTAITVARSGEANVVVSFEAPPPAGVSPEGMLEIMLQAIPSWPTEVVFAIPSGFAGDQLNQIAAALDSRDVRWMAALRGSRADVAPIGAPSCVGAIVFSDHPEDAANLAWRGLPEEVPQP